MAEKPTDQNLDSLLEAAAQRSADSSSTDGEIRKQATTSSHELTRIPSAASVNTDDSKVYRKSFGIRKQEIQSDCYRNWWIITIHFVTLFLGSYVHGMESGASSVFVGYATGSYRQHSLMSTIAVIRSVVAASCLPAYARLSDIYGRFEMFWFGMLLRVIGLIVMSQANTVHKYAGGSALYGAGYAGGRILFQISAQDATTLRYRFMSNAIASLPVIITTWTSGEVNDSLLERHGWKFGIALWAFTLPLSNIPYGLSCLYVRWKASKTPEWKKVVEEEKASQTELVAPREAYRLALQNGSASTKFVAALKMFYHYIIFRAKEAFWEADLMGCFLVVCVFGFLLVPLTLAGGSQTRWQQASIIVPLVIGFCFVPVFIFWELKFARLPLVPFPLLRDRGIWSGFAIGVMNTFSSGIPGAFAYPVLLVGMNSTVAVATRTPLLHHFVTALTLPFIAFLVLKVKRTKAFVFIGCAGLFVSMGLFVHFRGDNDGLRDKYFRDGIAVAFSIEGFGNAFFVKTIGISLQACTNYEYMATVTAMFAALYNIGYSCARCVAGAIWTQKMYPLIAEKMVMLGVNATLAKDAYQDPYTFAKKHPWGTPPRRAVALAYAQLQRQLCVVAVCLLVPLLVLSFFLRDHKLEDVRSLENVGDEEKGKAAGERSKSAVIYTDDDDMILNFLRRVVGRPKK